MTQLRKFRDSISNYFDNLERGIGKRGSTFTDVDAITHDADTKRFLFREFKEPTELLDKAQHWTLTELAGLPRCEVWFVRRMDGGLIGWYRFPATADDEVVITEAEYRELLAGWWRGERRDPRRTSTQTKCLHRAEFIDNGVCWICAHTGANG